MTVESKIRAARLALASGSPRRLALLQQIGVEPDALLPADLDEQPGRNESPRKLAARLALEKARVGARTASSRAAQKITTLMAENLPFRRPGRIPNNMCDSVKEVVLF